MKRLFTLSALLALLLSSAAFGIVQDFGNFTLDIPQDWTAELFEEDTEPGNYTLNIEKNDQSSLMSFTYGKTDGYSIEDLLEDWINMEGGASKPKRTSDGYYIYIHKNDDGPKTTTYIRSESDGKMYVAVDMIGKDVQTMTAIRDSFALKNSEVSEPEAHTEKRYYSDNTELILAAYEGYIDEVKTLLKAGSGCKRQE
ncbi:MAG: hypothetical protein IJU48_06105 [Synergistaceae bacterium]|nr:hypothetical protein [Synergistaceae bacterium]